MKNLKTGTFLIILGNLLYLAYIIFSGSDNSKFAEFSSGLLVGLSIGCNLIGIILTVMYMSKNKKNNNLQKWRNKWVSMNHYWNILRKTKKKDKSLLWKKIKSKN